jgi:hypothetical protein
MVPAGVLAGDRPQVPFADDQHPVRALAACTGDPAFRDGFGRGGWAGAVVTGTPTRWTRHQTPR